MGNTISATTQTNTSLDLANGDTKVKKNLEVVGVSTFTGKSTFNGDLSVTNGKFNSIDVPTLSTDVGTLKTNVATLQTTVTNVSAGSFTGKAISGATDVTATGTGEFNALKTNNIDINGEILSTTGKKYVTTSATGLSFTNGVASGQPANAQVNLQSDGTIQLTHGTGKSINLGSSVKVVNNSLEGVGVFATTGQMTAGGALIANGNLSVNGTTTLTGALAANGGITVPSGKNLILNGSLSGKTISGTSLSIDGASTLTGATTATGAITANGGLTSSTLTVSGASTHTGTTTLTGATTATGAITANGGITSSTLTVSGASTHTGTTTLTGATTATGAITANGGITSSALTVSGATTASGDLNAKNVIIGTQKWLIEENVDANKGTRLCFGKVDAQATGGKRFYTCMNSNGNLELF
jgi:hypothetical protein